MPASAHIVTPSASTCRALSCRSPVISSIEYGSRNDRAASCSFSVSQPSLVISGSWFSTTEFTTHAWPEMSAR